MTQYNRFYCYRCSAYPPEGVFMEPHTPTASDLSQSSEAGSSTGLVVVEPAKPRDLPPTAETEQTDSVGSVAEEEVQAEPQKHRRPLDREEITTAKKPLLAQLCKDYELDSSGTREELRQRLLSYLDQLEGTSSEASAESTEGEAEEQGVTEPDEGESLEPAASEAQAAPEAVSNRTEPQVDENKPEPQPSTPSIAASITAVETSPKEAVPEAVVEPAAVATPSREPTAIAAPSYPTARVEHPCPTCGRALTYIPQYGRWYCYSCRAYAPRAKAKFACPNCGASLRWITQYSRWWCDACRRYAPADLPKPERSVEPVPAAQAVTSRPAVATVATAVVHRHQSPGSGIGLVTFGLLLFVVYEVLVDLPVVLSVNVGFTVDPEVAFGLRFFAILFVAIGTIIGLAAIRDRR